MLALQRTVGNARVNAIVATREGRNSRRSPPESTEPTSVQCCPETGTPGCDCPREFDVSDRQAAHDDVDRLSENSVHVQRQPAGEIQPGSDVGNFVIRLSEDRTIEFLYETPDVPVTGPLGVGFRCRNGRCVPVGGQEPSDITNRTYSLPEALDLLRGLGGQPGPAGGPLPGLGGPGRPFPPSPPGPRLCLPWEQTPSGRCCPPGQRWSGHGNDCAPPSSTGPTQVPGPPTLTLPPLFPPPTLGGPGLRLGLLQLRRIDHFAVGADTLPAGAGQTLDRLAAELNASPDQAIRIEGHTDSTADPALNQALSERRARAVAQALGDRGIEARRLIVTGLGEQQLRNPEERTPEEKAQNRQVEVWFHVPAAQPPPTPFTLPGAGPPPAAP